MERRSEAQNARTAFSFCIRISRFFAGLLVLLAAACQTVAAQTITEIRPTSAVAGTPGLTLTINGTFTPTGLHAYWVASTEQELAIQQATATQLTVNVPPDLLTSPQTAEIYVFNDDEPPSNTVFFNITEQVATLDSISPTSRQAQSSGFTLTVNGTHLPNGTLVTWNGNTLATSYVSSAQLTATVPASLIATPGTAAVNITTVPAQPDLTFTITGLTVTSITPNTAVAGSPSFLLTVNGSGYSPYSQVTWNGSALSTNFVNSGQLTANVPASLVASPGSAMVSVQDSGQASPPALPFFIYSMASLTSLSPNSAFAGRPAFTLTVNGTGFVSGAIVTWNGTNLTTSFVNSGQLTAQVPAPLVATSGTAAVTVAEPGQESSPSPLTFTINPDSTLTSLSPSAAVAGGAAFTLTVNGANFISGTQVTWNGSNLATTFVNSGQLTAQVPASLIASAGTASVNINTTPQPSPLTFTITTALSISNISPTSAVAGGAGFTLTVNGAGFTGATAVTWNGSALTTTFVNAGQLTAAVPASLIASAGTAAVTVSQSGQTSPPAVTLTINGAATLTSLSPNSAVAGGAAFTLTVNGANFISGTQVTWNGTNLTTNFVNSGQLTAQVSASLIASAGTASVNITATPQPSPLAFTVLPAMNITRLTPSEVVAGSTDFALIVDGTNFTSATQVTWNGDAISTTFVSSTRLTASIPAARTAAPGTVSVGVAISGHPTAAPVDLTIYPPAMLISLSPNSALTGGTDFTLTVNGANFIPGTQITWNGNNLITSVVNSRQLIATIPAALIASPGNASIDINASPLPAPLTFVVTQTIAVSGISPLSTLAGGPSFVLTVNGAGFTSGAQVTWNGSSLNTTFMSDTQLTAVVPSALITAPGGADVSVTVSGQTSPPAVLFKIVSPASLTSLSPNSTVAGSPSFNLTVNGANLLPGTQITWNGTTLNTSFLSSTQLSATVPASLVASAGTASVNIDSNPQPNPLVFTVTSSVSISSISPQSSVAGGPAFSLTVNGSGFTAETQVTWSGTPLPTTFINSGQLSANVPASVLVASGTSSVTVAAPGQTSPPPVIFNIVPSLTLTSLSPPSAAAGSAALTLTVNGTGLDSTTMVVWNATTLTTTIVNAGQATASIPATLLAQAGTASVSLMSSNQKSNAIGFTIVPPGAPALTSIAPSTAPMGSPGFTLSAIGSGFTSSTQITWNGVLLSTNFVSTTQITATIPANLVAAPGTAAVGIATPGQTNTGTLPFVIIPAAIILTNLSPASATAGSAGFLLTASGAGFTPNTRLVWNGLTLPTTYVSGTQLTASVAANLIAQAGTGTVVAQDGAQTSNSLSFPITAPSLSLISLAPSSVVVNSPGFVLSVNGSGFTSAAIVLWNGAPLATTFISSNQLTASVAAAQITQVGNANVAIQNGNQLSAPLPFAITAPPATLTGLSPNSAPAGSPSLTITVTGTGFQPPSGTIVTWNGTPLATRVISSSELSAVVPAGLLTNPSTASVSATGLQRSLPFTITAGPLLTNISPSRVQSAGPAFTLTLTGAGFTGTTVATLNGSPLPTTYVSATQLTAIVPASAIATAGTVAIGLSVPGQVSPPTLPLSIIQGLVLTSLSPSSISAGSATFTLVGDGAGLVPGASLLWNGVALPTNYVSPTRLTATVAANLVAQAGQNSVTASLGDQVSNALPFKVLPVTPTITSISPTPVIAGSVALTLTVNGTDFASGAVVYSDSTPLSTTFIGSTQVTAALPPSLMLRPQSVQITLVNPNNATSNAVALRITLPVPAITKITPSTVTAGGSAFDLAITGTNFFPGLTVSFNDTKLSTTYLSSSQATAQVPAELIAKAATALITSSNSATASSNALSLNITAPPPSITSVSPNSVVAGGSAFTLSVAGANFVSGATVLLSGTALSTTFGSPVQLSAAVPAALIVNPGTGQITVTNPGGVASNALPLTILGPAPAVSGISPTTVTVGGPAFDLEITGGPFSPGAVVKIGDVPLDTTVDSPTHVTAKVPLNFITQPGEIPITVTNPGGAPSVPIVLIVAPSPASPVISTLSPSSVKVLDAGFTLAVKGSGFAANSVVQWNGAALTTSFVSSVELDALVPQDLLALPAAIAITVANPVAGGSPALSSPSIFNIDPVTPVITSISPESVTAGDPAFTLTLTGNGFLAATEIRFNDTILASHLVSNSQVTADVPASLLTTAGTFSIIAVNPGRVTSAGAIFTVRPLGPPSLTNLSQTSATAGGAAFTFTLTGTNFTSAAVVNFGTTPLATTFVSATQLTADVPATVLALPGTVQITVQQSGAISAGLPFSVNLPAPPSLRLNAPSTAGPTQQPAIDFGLNSGYPIALTGTLVLSFASNASIAMDDPAIQFASGGRTINFTVAPNTTTLPPVLLTTGTIAGTITLRVTLRAAGVDVTPAAASATITIARSAPVIRTLTLVHTSGGLDVDVTGFSSTLDVTSASFQFKDSDGNVSQALQSTLPVGSIFSTWFQSAAAATVGAGFTYAQPFSVTGDAGRIVSVTVTLTNSAGTSQPFTLN